jgi:hypothetical protein
MEDYIHAAKVGQHSIMELAQSYLKGYASTWWRTVRQKEGKTHGYTWNSSRNASSWNSFQRISITFQDANFVTL